MNISVIGVGYVGLVSGVCFSELGNKVICVDKDITKIEMLKRGEVPIYEPGLKELIDKNVKAGRLSFTNELSESVQASEIIIIAVGTPSLPNGEANLQYIEQAAREIALAINEYKVIMTKSTVPVGTNEKIAQMIYELTEHPFDVVSVPEFLREGSAIKDTLYPDRIIIGTDSKPAEQKAVELHSTLTDQIIVTDIRSAEMIKYASNAFLATKISFINEIANICEKVNADVTLVAKGMGLDKRIGPSFLNAGIGYGGSCFPKDTEALIQIAGNANYEFKLLKSVVEVNKHQRFNVINKLEDLLGNLSSKTIGIWGLAFKPNTDDVRDAPSIEIVETLIKKGCIIKVYDPIAINNFRKVVNHENIVWCDSITDAAIDCHGVCLLTEWNEFKEVDLKNIEKLMKLPVFIDGRNVYAKERIEETGLNYYSIGRPDVNQSHIADFIERVK
ncbi:MULTISPECIES: UDP-glucose dehydrogenase family protein [Paenibacillus]|uniref:UDP-glucose 6-dehydrogenase n=1 Tax=Paenibacillus naphthalenovorans TaxID=162209 RepID=A0A0U2VAV9_9BACL|nr:MULTISPECIES: UDP-glucose/GDP-mannose dehydrogenase family protein [Paenibacillus]ALS20723.1 UDP-glucose 6-dehydrogenase [Paenibacillus naphthalenovorans]GCL70753.1 UDP-glucose/GDP-mannose dehydrogenase family protein [Paenibacillus naphthalenovorans]SDI24211.1 UDPglucose 6-dehydrogenase [Paenibacillus naphthalenovorans]